MSVPSGAVSLVRTGVTEGAAVLTCQRRMDVWCHAVGDVHFRRGAVGRPQRPADPAED